MIDFVKIRVLDQVVIENLLSHPDFVSGKSLTNYYYTKINILNKKIFLHFRKSYSNNVVLGYCALDITISPHYHKNSYNHNGNTFTPNECIGSIIEILDYLIIDKGNYVDLKVVNLEFGVNVIPFTDVTNILKGIIFYKKSEFIKKYAEIENFKISKTSKFKEVKIYAKGLQFVNNPEYNINPNTLRFEVRIKESKSLKRFNIYTVNDLLNLENYIILINELLKEWEHILLVNVKPNLTGLKNKSFVIECVNYVFWKDIILKSHRNTFVSTKKRYYKLLKKSNNLHTEIKALLIDCFNSFFDVQIPHREVV